MTIPNPINASNPGVREQLLQLQVGRPAASGPYNKIRSMVATAGSQAQVDTFDVVSPAVGDVYQVVVEGIAVSYTAASTVEADEAAAIAAAINANPNARAIVRATSLSDNGTLKVVLTCTVKGSAITVTAKKGSTTLTVTTTAATASSDIPFGRLVVSGGYLSGVAAATESCGLPAINISEADLNADAAGVSVRQATEGTVIKAGSAFGVMASGDIPVEVDPADMASITKGGNVYVHVAAGANRGRFYPASAVGRVQLTAAKWQRAANNSADAMAVLRISLD